MEDVFTYDIIGLLSVIFTVVPLMVYADYKYRKDNPDYFYFLKLMGEAELCPNELNLWINKCQFFKSQTGKEIIFMTEDKKQINLSFILTKEQSNVILNKFDDLVEEHKLDKRKQEHRKMFSDYKKGLSESK